MLQYGVFREEEPVTLETSASARTLTSRKNGVRTRTVVRAASPRSASHSLHSFSEEQVRTDVEVAEMVMLF